MRGSTSDITKLSVGISTISSSLGGQTLYAFRGLYKFQAWQMTTVTVIHSVRKDALYLSTLAVNCS